MSDLTANIQAAAVNGQLLESSAKNLVALLAKTSSPLDEAAIRELVDAGDWKELDNRFFRTLAFGTGGLRGKTIGAVLTRAERGTPQELDRPEFPCVGTNAMNYYNISRATQGLVAYVKEYFTQSERSGKPSICISHDTRFFSREFAELAAKVMVENGSNAYLFEGPRSTPELSFSVRYTKSQAGINITASHNPPEYNGYKVYRGWWSSRRASRLRNHRESQCGRK
jgi:phosphoglucomutase